MKKIILSLLIALTFTACSTSSLSLSKSNDLELNYNKKTRIIASDAKKEELLNFSDLLVHQYTMVGSEGNVLFGEYGETDLTFQFAKSELSTLMYVFDNSRKYEMVYKRNNLQLVQIQLKDKTYVNALIHANNPQDYHFVYGFTNKEFVKIANAVKVKDTEVILPKFDGVTFDEFSASQTNWNDKLVYFTPLIEPIRGMRGR